MGSDDILMGNGSKVSFDSLLIEGVSREEASRRTFIEKLMANLNNSK